MTEYSGALAQQLNRFDCDPQRGLTARQAEEGLASYGQNIPAQAKHPGPLQRFLLRLLSPMSLLLAAAALTSFTLALFSEQGGLIEPVAVLVLVCLNAALEMRREVKTQKALSALEGMSVPMAKVIRDGELCVIPAARLAPGDMAVLEAGEIIPADGRLVESDGLVCEESALTGESAPVHKDHAAQVADGAPLGERFNMVYSGCAVTEGRGRFLVTATGANTELAKSGPPPHTPESEGCPLHGELELLGRRLGLPALGACAVIFAVGLLRGLPPIEMFLTGVALAVTTIPEGLPAAADLALALGVRRMAKQGAVLRELNAVPALERVSVICSDKTGVLTLGRMTVRKLWPLGSDAQDFSHELSQRSAHLLRLGALCSDGLVEVSGGELKHMGDPTETALLAAALELGMPKAELEKQFPRVAGLTFDSDRKLMTTVHRVGGKLLAITKGDFDALLPLCVNSDNPNAARVSLGMGKSGLRVIAVACRELDTLPAQLDVGVLERGLTFVGLIGISDPPREDSGQAAYLCRQAGIRAVMLTGDHPAAAVAVAGELGILRGDGAVIDGEQLAEMSDDELAENAHRYSVYARVRPGDKARVLGAWQAGGEVVAVTGSGGADASALRAADVGCAMGSDAAGVSAQAADIILTDGSFSAIVEAVRQGRGICANIRKVVVFLLIRSLGELSAMFFAVILGWGMPLSAVHLLLVNAVTDAFPAPALGAEPPEEEIMTKIPSPAGRSVLDGRLSVAVLIQGLTTGILTLLAYYIGMRTELSRYVPPSRVVGMTMAFLVLCLSQLCQAASCRSVKSVFSGGFFSNKAMARAILFSAGAVVLICLAPAPEALLRLHDLSMLHWLLAAALSLAPLIPAEAAKALVSLKERAV